MKTFYFPPIPEEYKWLAGTQVVVVVVCLAVLLQMVRKTLQWTQDAISNADPASKPAPGDASGKDTFAIFVLGTAQGINQTFYFSFLSQMLFSFKELDLQPGEPTDFFSIWLLSLFCLGQVLAAPLWGFATDLLAPRPLFNMLNGMSILSLICFGMAPCFFIAGLARFFHGLVDGTQLALTVFMGDVENRGGGASVIGAQIGSTAVGTMLGTLFGGFVGMHLPLVPTEYPFLPPCLAASAVCLLGSWAVMQGTVGLTGRNPPRDVPNVVGLFFEQLGELLNPPFLLAVTVFALCLGTTITNLVVMSLFVSAEHRYMGLGFTGGQMPAFALTCVLGFLVGQSLFMSKIINAFGYSKGCAVALLLTLPFLALQPLASYAREHSWPVMFGLLVGCEIPKRTLFCIAGSCAILSCLAVTRKEIQGTASGILSSAGSVMGIIAPILAGPLFGNSVLTGWSFPFNFALCWLVLMGVVVVITPLALMLRNKEKTD